MQGSPGIIAQLNKMLFNELTAINQYFLHARMLKAWGFKALGEKIYEESLGEMRHADKLTERILFLQGLPNFQALGKLRIGEKVEETLRGDLVLETESRTDAVASIEYFERERDYVSRKLASDILVDSEEHIDFLETQLGLLQAVGEANYLQLAVGELDEE